MRPAGPRRGREGTTAGRRWRGSGAAVGRQEPPLQGSGIAETAPVRTSLRKGESAGADVRVPRNTARKPLAPGGATRTYVSPAGAAVDFSTEAVLDMRFGCSTDFISLGCAVFRGMVRRNLPVAAIGQFEEFVEVVFRALRSSVPGDLPAARPFPYGRLGNAHRECGEFRGHGARAAPAGAHRTAPSRAGRPGRVGVAGPGRRSPGPRRIRSASRNHWRGGMAWPCSQRT